MDPTLKTKVWLTFFITIFQNSFSFTWENRSDFENCDRTYDLQVDCKDIFFKFSIPLITWSSSTLTPARTSPKRRNRPRRWENKEEEGAMTLAREGQHGAPRPRYHVVLLCVPCVPSTYKSWLWATTMFDPPNRPSRWCHTHTNTNGKPTRSAAWIRSYRISLKSSRVCPCSRIESQVCIHMHACKHERGATRAASSFSRCPAGLHLRGSDIPYSLLVTHARTTREPLRGRRHAPFPGHSAPTATSRPCAALLRSDEPVVLAGGGAYGRGCRPRDH
jgi:hypothetical protein